MPPPITRFVPVMHLDLPKRKDGRAEHVDMANPSGRRNSYRTVSGGALRHRRMSCGLSWPEPSAKRYYTASHKDSSPPDRSSSTNTGRHKAGCSRKSRNLDSTPIHRHKDNKSIPARHPTTSRSFRRANHGTSGPSARCLIHCAIPRSHHAIHRESPLHESRRREIHFRRGSHRHRHATRRRTGWIGRAQQHITGQLRCASEPLPSSRLKIASTTLFAPAAHGSSITGERSDRQKDRTQLSHPSALRSRRRGARHYEQTGTTSSLI
jgi:hypothetical protein